MNPFDVLKNAKVMQEQISRIQAELSSERVTGSSGGGIVKITLNGQFEVIQAEIDPVAVDSRDVPMLQDLIVAAHRDAFDKVKDLLKNKLGPLAGTIPGL